MQRCQAQPLDCGDMRGRAIALVLRPAVTRVGYICLDHDPITNLFGDDGCRRDARMQGIAPDDRLGAIVPIRQAVAINKDALRTNGERVDSTAHREHSRLQDVERIDFGHVRHPHADMAVRANERLERGTALGAQLLAVVEPVYVDFTQNDRRGNNWPREWPPARFVHAGDNHRSRTAWCPIGPCPAPNPGALISAARTNNRARAIASIIVIPCPSPQAIALASVQPVPWV